MTKNELIISHINLADTLAKAKKKAVGKKVYYEELQAAAYRGLVDAAHKYDEGNGAFRSYASCRIKGEMNDYLRELRWGTKRNPINVNSLKVDLAAEGNVDCRELAEAVLRMMPKRVRMMFEMHCGGLTMKEIGKKVGLSESMVSKMMKWYRESIRGRVFEAA